MPCGYDPLHLAPWRERITLVPPLKEDRTWTPETEEALRNLKALLTNAPIFVSPLREKPS
jgi:hypothetical protein